MIYFSRTQHKFRFFAVRVLFHEVSSPYFQHSQIDNGVGPLDRIKLKVLLPIFVNSNRNQHTFFKLFPSLHHSIHLFS